MSNSPPFPPAGPEQACPNPEAFKAGMERTFDAIRLAGEADGSGGFKNSAEALANVLELIRQHHVSLPGHICAVVVTTLVLEGWSNKLDPDHSVLTQVGPAEPPYIVEWTPRSSRAPVCYAFVHIPCCPSLQVQTMFEGTNVPWRERLHKAVDYVMEAGEQHALA